MNTQANDAGTIDYSPTEPTISATNNSAFSFSLVAMGAGQAIKYWAVLPTGYPKTDYQLGRNFGREVVKAAGDKPRVMAVMLTKAMMAIPEPAADYEQMLKGLFDCITEELARSAAIGDAANYEVVELAPPPA